MAAEIREDDPGSQKMMEQFLAIYEEACAQEGSGVNTPTKEKLSSLMWQKLRETTSRRREPSAYMPEPPPPKKVVHQYIIDDKVDGRALKMITKLPEPGKPRNKKGDPVFPLPYLPECVDYSRCCQALVLNGQLFTPCLTTPAKGNEFCKQCKRTNFKYGLLKDRRECAVGIFKQPGGKKVEIQYGEFLEKRGLTKAQVMERISACLEPELSSRIEIPESYFETASRKASTKKRGRPSKYPMPAFSGDFDEIVGAAEDYTSKLVRDTMGTRGPSTQEERSVEEESLEEIEQEIDDVFPPPKIDFEEKDSQGRTFFTYPYDGGYYYFDESHDLYRLVFEDEYAKVGMWDVEKNEPVFVENSGSSSDSDSDEEEEVEYNVFVHNGKKYVYNETERLIHELLIEDDEPVLGEEVGNWDAETNAPIWKEKK